MTTPMSHGPPCASLDGLFRIWFVQGTTAQYYPLLYSAFWLEHRVWANSVFCYHALNVLLRASGAYLLTWNLRFLRLRGAWLAGFLFALHPVCVEGVAWIAEQKSTLETQSDLAAPLASARNGPRFVFGVDGAELLRCFIARSSSIRNSL
jgi:hypothetical protein